MFIYEPPPNFTDSVLKGEGNIFTEKYISSTKVQGMVTAKNVVFSKIIYFISKLMFENRYFHVCRKISEILLTRSTLGRDKGLEVREEDDKV